MTDADSLDLDDVDLNRRAEVALDVVRAQRRRWARVCRRPPALRPVEALHALEFEAAVLFCADPTNPVDRQRIALAHSRIFEIVSDSVGRSGAR